MKALEIDKMNLENKCAMLASEIERLKVDKFYILFYRDCSKKKKGLLLKYNKL